MSELKIKVNEKSLIANLRLAFTDSMTVISELMQNGRRARASRVDIAFDAPRKTLYVADDGCGIDDLQKLLTVAESGWDEATKSQETPYGLGFLSALYACSQIRVISRGTMTLLDTKKLLAYEPAVLETENVMAAQTVISLIGFKGSLDEVKRRVEDYAAGFAIPVSFNGVEIERPDALDNGLFVETEVGMMSVGGIHRGKAGSCGNAYGWMCGYLQGHQVFAPRSGRHDGITIVHFDPTKYFGRMPDRNCLVNADEATAQVKVVIARLWREHLREQFAALSQEDFVEIYLEAVQIFAPELLNELDFIPGYFVGKVEDYPIKSEDYTPAISPVVRRTDLESGTVTLYAEPDDLDYTDGESARAWMFLYAKKATVLTKALPEGHWAGPFLVDLDDADMGLELIEPGNKGSLHGHYVGGNVQLCAAYKLSSPLAGEVVIEQDAICDPEHGFIVPAKSTCGEVVQQAGRYIGENESFDETCRDQDWEEMENLICRLRSKSPEEFFAQLLKKIDLRWTSGADQQLFGKAFRVEISPEGQVTVAAAA